MAGKPLRRERRQADVATAVLGLLAEHGWHGFGMRDVAKRSRQSIGNLYHHAADKQEVVYRALVARAEGAVASAQAVATTRGARRRLEALAHDHVGRLVEAPAEALLWRGPRLPLHEPQRRRLEALCLEYEATCHELVAAVLRPRVERRSALARRMRLFFAMAEHAATEVRLAAGTLSSTRAADEVLDVFLGGRARS